MKLQKREKIMAISILALVAVLPLYYFWPSGTESIAQLRSQRDNLQKKVEVQNNLARQVDKAAKRLAELNKRALPADSSAALIYQNWLRSLADRIFQAPALTARDGQFQKDIYKVYTYEITCQGTLEQLTKFMYEFYSAGHLHKIHLITISPAEKTVDQLMLKITVDAMSLPGSTQKDKLSAEPAKPLKLTSFDEYKKVIVGRNIFTAYTPPKPPANNRKPPETKPDPKLDPLQFSYLTAIIEADGIPEAWVFERTSGDTLKLHEGEDFTIGKVKGKVNRIGYNDMEIEIDGQPHVISYGGNLKM